MANVNSNRDRGQLILVTGLLIAVALVTLVLLMNIAIYTENLASRGTDQSGREAIEYRTTVIESVGGLVDEENDREHEKREYVEGNVSVGIGRIQNLTVRRYAIGGTVVRINQSTVSVRQGRLIRQTNPREFRNESGETDWEIASGLAATRDFRLTAGDLEPSSEGDVVSDDVFYVELEGDGGGTWQAFLYETGSSVAVATRTNTDPPDEVCIATDDEAKIDLTRGTVDGEPCAGLRWAEGISAPYDVQYRNGDNVTGTFNLTIDTEPGSASFNGTNLDDGPSNAVYQVPAVYGTSFNVSYETPTLTYRGEIWVAPGEPE